jgi:hypothetical protein
MKDKNKNPQADNLEGSKNMSADLVSRPGRRRGNVVKN